MSDKATKKRAAQLPMPSVRRVPVIDMVAHRIEALVRGGQLRLLKAGPATEPICAAATRGKTLRIDFRDL